MAGLPAKEFGGKIPGRLERRIAGRFRLNHVLIRMQFAIAIQLIGRVPSGVPGEPRDPAAILGGFPGKKT